MTNRDQTGYRIDGNRLESLHRSAAARQPNHALIGARGTAQRSKFNARGRLAGALHLHHRHETLHVRVPLLGRHSVHTALRAAAVGLVEGLSWQEILEGLQGVGATQLRLVAVTGPEGSVILDDTYKATSSSGGDVTQEVAAIATALRPASGGADAGAANRVGRARAPAERARMIYAD